MRTILLAALLALLPASPALGEEVRTPKPILDEADLSIHVVETACNTYFVTCKRTRTFVLVDPGSDVRGTAMAWKRRGLTPKAIWLTHEHGDHVGGLGPVAAELKVPIVAHADALAWMKRRARQGAVLPDTIVAEGAVVEVGSTRWKVLHVPGHARGSIGFVLDGRVLVAGDTLFKGSVGRSDLPGSDPAALARSLGKKIWPLADAVRVLPGHGPHTTVGAEKRTNRLFQDMAAQGRGETPTPRPWVGVRFDPEHTGAGLRLVEVTRGSPAAAAGLRPGDVLLELDGVALTSIQDVVGVLGRNEVGDTVLLVYLRGTERVTGKLTFGRRPTR